MFIERNKFFLWLVILSCFVFNAKAEDEDKALQEFLQGSEIAIQRTVVKNSVIGKKGLFLDNKKETIDELFSSEVVDPFNNKKVNTTVDYAKLDDGIEEEEIEELELEELDSVASLREQIDILLIDAEKKAEFDPIEVLNYLKIDRIMTSPKKYVVILGKKYSETDEIQIKVSNEQSKQDFLDALNKIEVDTKKVEDTKLVEEMKEDAKERYDEILKSINLSRGTVEIESINSKEVSFIINNKKYLLRMNK